MGETWEDRLDMAVSLAELGIDSIPLNALMPIPGTPLEHLERISEDDILRTIAFFRYINPSGSYKGEVRCWRTQKNGWQKMSFVI